MEPRSPPFGQPVRSGRRASQQVVLLRGITRHAVAGGRQQVAPRLAERRAPVSHVVGRAPHPAHVLFERNEVGDRIQLAVLIAQRDGRTRRIDPFERRMQFADIGRHVVAAHARRREKIPHITTEGWLKFWATISLQLLAGRSVRRRGVGEVGDVAQIRRARAAAESIHDHAAPARRSRS